MRPARCMLSTSLWSGVATRPTRWPVAYDDGGVSWSTPGRLKDRAGDDVAGGGRLRHWYVASLALGDDRLTYRGAHEGRGGPLSQGSWRLVMARSDNGGESWTQTRRWTSVPPPPPSGSWCSCRRSQPALDDGTSTSPSTTAALKPNAHPRNPSDMPRASCHQLGTDRDGDTSGERPLRTRPRRAQLGRAGPPPSPGEGPTGVTGCLRHTLRLHVLRETY